MMKRFVYAKIAGFLTWPIFSSEVNNFGQSRPTERPVSILINQFRWANSEREREKTRENGRANACLATDREMQNNNKMREGERERDRERVPLGSPNYLEYGIHGMRRKCAKYIPLSRSLPLPLSLPHFVMCYAF